MSKTKVIIIGAGPTSTEMAIIAKRIADTVNVTLLNCQTMMENAASQMQKISELNSKSIRDFSAAVNDLNVSLKIEENSQPKSKYINNPRHNFKNRGIPQKRNNRNYYKK